MISASFRSGRRIRAAARIDPKSVVAWNELASALVIAGTPKRWPPTDSRIGRRDPGNFFARSHMTACASARKPWRTTINSWQPAAAGSGSEFQARQRARLGKGNKEKR
jgi:hypothetical protein